MKSYAHDTITPDIETSSTDYANRFEGKVGRYFLETQRAGVCALIEKIGCHRATILEVGGGHCQLTEFLISQGHEVCLHGSHGKCFAHVGEKVKVGPIRTVVSSLRELPFADREFDLVIAVRLLSHVEDPQVIVGEMCRVSKMGVIVDYPSKTALNVFSAALFEVKKRLEGNTRPYFSYRDAEIDDYFETFDFKKRATFREFVIPMGLHRAFKSKLFSNFAENMLRRIGVTAMFGSPVLAAFTKNPG